MRNTISLQENYNSFVQEIYKELLKKEGFRKAQGKFVQTTGQIIYSVAFHSFYKNDKKKDTIGFRIYAEARLKNETQLRRENRLKSGRGAYYRAFPDVPKQNLWSGRLEYSQEDQKLIECFQIQKHTDLTQLKNMVSEILDEALHDLMRFQTQEDLVAYLNTEHADSIKSNTAYQRRHALIEFMVYGLLGVGACIAAHNWFPLTFVSALYYEIVIEDMVISDLWFRRLLSIPIAELLASLVLLSLLWSKTIEGSVYGGVCIGLFFSGLLNLVIHIYNRYKRKKIEELLNNRRFWGGA